jgi:hypothetical protein
VHCQAIAEPLKTRQFPEIKTQGLTNGKKALPKSLASFRSTVTKSVEVPPEIEELAEEAHHWLSNSSVRTNEVRHMSGLLRCFNS